jgi:hypothetical protein
LLLARDHGYDESLSERASEEYQTAR